MCGREHRSSERSKLKGFATSMRGILKTRKGTTNATWRWLAPKP